MSAKLNDLVEKTLADGREFFIIDDSSGKEDNKKISMNAIQSYCASLITNHINESFVQKEDGYGLCNIKRLSVADFGDIVTHDTVMQDGTVSGMTLYTKDGVDNLIKADKSKIITTTTQETNFNFLGLNNTELRIGVANNIAFIINDGEYPDDYTSGISFDSGETPTTIAYTGTGILNWVGTDCSTDSYIDDEGVTHQVSIFQPSANTHYDIVFYYNGAQFIGLVNGFVPATGNVVSV